MDYNLKRAQIDTQLPPLEDELQSTRQTASSIEARIASLRTQRDAIYDPQGADRMYARIQQSMHTAMEAEFQTLEAKQKLDQEALGVHPVPSHAASRSQSTHASSEEDETMVAAEPFRDMELDSNEDDVGDDEYDSEASHTIEKDIEDDFMADAEDLKLLEGEEDGLLRDLETAVGAEQPMECDICRGKTKNVSLTVKLDCNHLWCKSCVTKLFELVTKDRGVFPPRCCKQKIDHLKVSHLLDADLMSSYKARSHEYIVKWPTYCRLPTCATFIYRREYHNIEARCSKCRNLTCHLCQRAWHDNTTCKEWDTDTLAFRDLKRFYQWQECPECHNLVELAYGCNHIKYAASPKTHPPVSHCLLTFVLDVDAAPNSVTVAESCGSTVTASSGTRKRYVVERKPLKGGRAARYPKLHEILVMNLPANMIYGTRKPAGSARSANEIWRSTCTAVAHASFSFADGARLREYEGNKSMHGWPPPSRQHYALKGAA
jgi:IBR domain, a half RING-finger domain